MKEQKITTIFTCDCCGKKSEERKDGEGFPYNCCWRYLYNLSYKKSKREQVSKKDKHFCSDKCMREFVDNELKRIIS